MTSWTRAHGWAGAPIRNHDEDEFGPTSGSDYEHDPLLDEPQDPPVSTPRTDSTTSDPTALFRDKIKRRIRSLYADDLDGPFPADRLEAAADLVMESRDDDEAMEFFFNADDKKVKRELDQAWDACH